MADKLVEGAVNASHDQMGLWGHYWSDVNKGVGIFVDDLNDISFARTTDGGVNWTTTKIETGTVRQVAAWYDKETPGDTGTLVHIAWLDEVAGDAYYITVDVDDGTQGTKRTIDATVTVSSTRWQNRIAITKTVGGNLLVAFSTQSEIECYRSVDAGVNWTTRADPFETASQEDWLLLFPADTADNDDICGIFWDRNTNEISIKMYDDSADTWTETSISTSMAEDDQSRCMDASIRQSDKHLLLAAHSDEDAAGDDLRVWDLTIDSIASPTVTAKTNVFTDQAESSQVSILINQQNDDVYVAYLKGGTWQATVDAVFHKSTNGMTSWGTEQAYSEATADDIRSIHGGRTVGDDGGRVQWIFYNDDLTDLFVNLVNDIEITAAAGVTVTPPNGALSYAGLIPTILLPILIAVGSVAFTYTGQVPIVTVDANVVVSPAQDTLTYSGQIPIVTATQNVLVTPAFDTLSYVGQVPIVTRPPSAAGYTLATDQGSSKYAHTQTNHLFYTNGTWWYAGQDNTGDDAFLWKWDGGFPAQFGDPGNWAKAALAGGGTVNLDTRNTAELDLIWDEANEELHVLSLHGTEYYNLWTYNSTLDEWTNTIANENIGIAIGNQNAGIIRDSAGVIWVAYYDNSLNTLRTRYRSGGSWSQGADIESTATDSAGLSRCCIFLWKNSGTDRVGVAYSYGAATDAWKFAWRNDSDGLGASWNIETIDNTTAIDDHVDGVAYTSGATSVLLIIGKDSSNAVKLWKRTTGGTWESPVAVTSGGSTRPKIVVDDSNAEVYAFYGDGGGVNVISRILYKKSAIGTLSFGSLVSVIEDQNIDGDFSDPAVPGHVVNSTQNLIIGANGPAAGAPASGPWWNRVDIAVAAGWGPLLSQGRNRLVKVV